MFFPRQDKTRQLYYIFKHNTVLTDLALVSHRSKIRLKEGSTPTKTTLEKYQVCPISVMGKG